MNINNTWPDLDHIASGIDEELHDHDHNFLLPSPQLHFDFLWPTCNNTSLIQPHHSLPSSSSSHVPTLFHFGHQSEILHRVVGRNEDQDKEEEEEDKDHEEDSEEEELGAMKEMMFKISAMQPVDIDPATLRKPKRRNVWISDDPQSVAARLRRERISEKVRILQRLVPGGTKMDTASMLDEAVRYVKFLKRHIRLLQSNHRHHCNNDGITSVGPGSTPIPNWPFRAPQQVNGSVDVRASTSTEPSAAHLDGKIMGFN